MSNHIYFMTEKVDEAGLLAAYILAKEYVETKSICAEALYAALEKAVIKSEVK